MNSILRKTKNLELAPFDASDYLDNEETIAEYLAAALENSDPDAFLAAVRDVAKARGITQIAEQAGLGRESLYKTLRPGAQPRFDTVRRLVAALGVRLDVVAVP
ncbi:MAG: putative addiction module antidote protein [Candidatus Electrothrix sp. AU1_5]|nr:putative addiction module antidote protein [Candidatus Electrothrix gigas]